MELNDTVMREQASRYVRLASLHEANKIDIFAVVIKCEVLFAANDKGEIGSVFRVMAVKVFRLCP